MAPTTATPEGPVTVPVSAFEGEDPLLESEQAAPKVAAAVIRAPHNSAAGTPRFWWLNRLVFMAMFPERSWEKVRVNVALTLYTGLKIAFRTKVRANDRTGHQAEGQ